VGTFVLPGLHDLEALQSGNESAVPGRLMEGLAIGIPGERRVAMPNYEFRCENCKKRFTLTLSIAEYEKKKFECPKCKSRKVKQEISSFQTVTSKKS
jgi:putative FmdB family regulatory protein